ncbi:hypothetical protein Bache_0517 [Bacteroides helcogenes P 36-108]|uniref:Uncharacterized protein n=1 Tax=Bacteroides helcogenes (strain ATCC 35417 / DSM 20613 / JCM 6297 / CCUG 15421 / P 36-108) TaxID=693979 RepID=E6SW17_BACT6|nr:hypothetical protein Bache_0517 [Bacteroides helcogenes P 36-108]
MTRMTQIFSLCGAIRSVAQPIDLRRPCHLRLKHYLRIEL